MMISKVLIANRGEIACRIIRTLKRLGIHAVAVYSDIDSNAMFVGQADSAYPLGGSSATDSYLNIDKIIKIAKESGADAIHPGYGFLSENAGFAKAVEDAGLKFIGPSHQSIAKMGSKDEAKSIMEKAGVPVIPGKNAKGMSVNDIVKEAKAIGLPVMIKAALGGGGKGMRIVHEDKALESAIESAKREAQSSFGDDALIIEKYLERARHIEVQIFADHQDVVHLFERDCSLQRRHQKVIEQAPASNLQPKTRETLYSAAIQAAKAISYTNAGTVEFMVDEKENVYFLEMNTRLQVEHPITECITGQDLVEWQLLIASGEPLPLKQEAIKQNGVAFEARLYAEDPLNDFLPATGIVKHIITPSHVEARLDLGIKPGDEIGIFYDPILAKLIVHGPTHSAALRKLQTALDQTEIVGITNNLNFLRLCARSDDFANHQIDTHYLSRHSERFKQAQMKQENALVLPAVLSCILLRANKQQSASRDPFSPWDDQTAWQLNGPALERVNLETPHGHIQAQVQHCHDGQLFVTLEDLPSGSITGTLQQGKLHYRISAKLHVADCYAFEEGFHLLQDGVSESFYYPKEDATFEDSSQDKSLVAPMPGIITNIWVKPGTHVHQGDKLLAMEAMKMEHTMSATTEGVIKSILYKVGDQVQQGSQLFEFETHA